MVSLASHSGPPTTIFPRISCRRWAQMAVVASPLAPSLLLILTKNHVVHQLLLAIFTSYKAKDAARVEKDPLRLLAAWHALREPSRHYTNQTIGHHRGTIAFQVSSRF